MYSNCIRYIGILSGETTLLFCLPFQMGVNSLLQTHFEGASPSMEVNSHKSCSPWKNGRNAGVFMNFQVSHYLRKHV